MLGFGKKQETRQPRVRKNFTDPRQSDIVNMPINLSKLQAGTKEMDKMLRCISVHYSKAGKDAFDKALVEWKKGETVTIGWQSYLNNQSTEIGLIYTHYADEDGNIPQGDAAQMSAVEFGELAFTERDKYYPVVEVNLRENGQRIGSVELTDEEQDLFSDIYWALKIQFDGAKANSDATAYSLLVGEIQNSTLPLQRIGLSSDQVRLSIEFNFSKAALDAGNFDDNLDALEVIKETLQKALKAAESACKALVNEPEQPDNQPANSSEKHLLDYLTGVIMDDEAIAQSFKTGFESRVNGLANSGKTDDQIVRALRLTGTYADQIKKAEDAKIEAEARQKNQQRVKTPKQGQNQDKQGKGKGGQQGKKQQPKGSKGKDPKDGDGGDKKKPTGPIWTSPEARAASDNLPKHEASYWSGRFSTVDGFNEDALKGKHVPAMMTITEVCHYVQSWLKAQARANGEDPNKVKIPAAIYAECKAAIEAANA